MDSMTRYHSNRMLFQFAIVMLTLGKHSQFVDAVMQLSYKDGSMNKTYTDYIFPFFKEENWSKTNSVQDTNSTKRGWEMVDLKRRKRDITENSGNADSAYLDWKHPIDDKDQIKESKGMQSVRGVVDIGNVKRGWEPLGMKRKRGWEAMNLNRKTRGWGEVDIFFDKDASLDKDKKDSAKRGWGGVEFPWGKHADEKDLIQREMAGVDFTTAKISQDMNNIHLTSDENEHFKRGWDGVEYTLGRRKSEKGSQKRGWDGVEYPVGKRGNEMDSNKRGWNGIENPIGRHPIKKDSQKRGWDGIGSFLGKRPSEKDPHNLGLDESEDSSMNHLAGKVSEKRGWDGINFLFGKHSIEKESQKRGWGGVEYPFGKRLDGPDAKQEWAGVDFVLGVNLGTDRPKRDKRGWEALNLHYRVGNAQNNNDGHKRGWEGLDTCACCHSSHRVLCCLTCSSSNPQPKTRLATKPSKSMFYVRDTVCKCCYSTNVMDCCELCEAMS